MRIVRKEKEQSKESNTFQEVNPLRKNTGGLRDYELARHFEKEKEVNSQPSG